MLALSKNWLTGFDLATATWPEFSSQAPSYRTIQKIQCVEPMWFVPGFVTF